MNHIAAGGGADFARIFPSALSLRYGDHVLLYFRVRNFRSFANEAELTLTSPSLRTNVPRSGQTWADVTERVAAIYGSNASGKSTLLDALHALGTAIRSPGVGSIYQPSSSRKEEDPATGFEIGFVSGGNRYHYEVEAAGWGITHEALYTYPKAARRKLFVRSQDGSDDTPTIDKGDSLTGPTAEVGRITRANTLFLAVANQYGHSHLAPIARALMDGLGMDYITFRDRQDEQVLRRVLMEIIASDTQVDLVKALLQAADLGIDHVEIRKAKIPEHVHNRLVRLLSALEEGTDPGQVDLPNLTDVIVFFHKGEEGDLFELPLSGESSGTLTWLTTAWHVLSSLKRGSLLLVDELEASLHPKLSRYLVQLFMTPHLNPYGAQLVFSTHSTGLLGNAPTKLLSPQNVWFTEKDPLGHSELFSLADFDNRPGNNSERRYLAGQFGATPDIDERLILQHIATPEEEPSVDG